MNIIGIKTKKLRIIVHIPIWRRKTFDIPILAATQGPLPISPLINKKFAKAFTKIEKIQRAYFLIRFIFMFPLTYKNKLYSIIFDYTTLLSKFK